MILLVGGCGFLGRSLTEYLAQRNYSMRVYDRAESINPFAQEFSSISYVHGDFSQIGTADTLFDGVTAIVHFIHTTIPSTSMANMEYDVTSNVIPSLRLLEQARKHGISRFIFVSSGGTVYGEPQHIPVSEEDPVFPLCSYGITKLAIEKYVQMFSRLYGLHGIVVRLSNPYGRGQLRGTPVGAVAHFLNCVSTGRPIDIWGDGSAIRDYIYIEDVVEALEQLITHQSLPPGVYNLGTKTGYSLNDILKEIRDITGVLPEVRYLENRPFDVRRIVLNADRLNSLLQWKPRISLQEGLRRMWAFVKERP
jgi:UDP-glucose 4-epimerase